MAIVPITNKTYYSRYTYNHVKKIPSNRLLSRKRPSLRRFDWPSAKRDFLSNTRGQAPKISYFKRAKDKNKPLFGVALLQSKYRITRTDRKIL